MEYVIYRVMLKDRFKNAVKNAREFFKEYPTQGFNSLILVPGLPYLIYKLSSYSEKPILTASVLCLLTYGGYLFGQDIKEFQIKKEAFELPDDIEKQIEEYQAKQVQENLPDLTKEDNINDVLDTPAFRP